MVFTAIKRLRRRLRKLRGMLRPRLLVFEDEQSIAEQPLVTAMLVNGPERDYLKKTFYPKGCVVRSDAPVWSWRLRRRVKETHADLLVCLSEDGCKPRWVQRVEHYTIPVWIRGEIRFDKVDELRAVSRNLKQDYKRIERNGLEYRVTREREQFQQFYDSMLIPYAKQAHGDSAYILGCDEFMRETAVDAELLLICKGDDVIAGQVLRYGGAIPQLWMLGMNTRCGDPVKLGALIACYVFSIQHLRDKGYEVMQAGSSKAFLSDGVIQFKRKWGLEITEARKPVFLLQVLGRGERVRQLLCKMPFCCNENGLHVAQVFLDNISELTTGKVIELDKLYNLAGIDHMNINILEGQSGEAVALSREFPDDVRLVMLNKAPEPE